MLENESPYLSRIQKLLMRSYGPHLYCMDNGFVVPKFSTNVQEYDFGTAPKAKALSLAWLIVKKVVLGLRYLSPKNEKKWLKTRIG